MKMFYTQNELGKLSKGDLLELTTFGGGNDTYFYSELSKTQEQDGEYSFHFNDGTVIYTQQKETYESVKLGKARFDLIMKSQESKKEQDEREQLFLDRANEMLAGTLEKAGAGFSRIENEAKSFRKNAETHLEVTKTKWDSQLDTLKAFEVESFNIKMEKVDKIISAFEKLLED